MNQKFYEDMLSHNLDKNIDAEKMWDERAVYFNTPYNDEYSGFSKKVIEYLNDRNFLRDFNVLDIGGGVGRYALPFSKIAKHVTMTDISGNMISFAKEKAQKEGLNNIDFIKMNWENSNLKELNMSKQYELSFASMCPALKTKEGLSNMIESSKKYCFIAQLIVDTDSFSEFIIEKAALKRGYHPHNDREAVMATFNLLWLKGYTPEINYLSDSFHFEPSVEDLKREYKHLIERAEKQSGFDLESAIKEYCKEDKILITNNITLAMISWKV